VQDILGMASKRNRTLESDSEKEERQTDRQTWTNNYRILTLCTSNL